jgi:hypothetical protein
MGWTNTRHQLPKNICTHYELNNYTCNCEFNCLKKLAYQTFRHSQNNIFEWGLGCWGVYGAT